MSDHIWNWKT